MRARAAAAPPSARACSNAVDAWANPSSRRPAIRSARAYFARSSTAISAGSSAACASAPRSVAT